MPKTHQGHDAQGQFTEGSQAAREAGRKGGKAAQRKGTAHRLTRDERKKGGERSRSSGEE